MGCDIHTYTEQYDEETEQWFMLRNELLGDRNYMFFAALAGVRGEGPEAKGLPNDLSLGVKHEYKSWGLDAHTPSWYTLEEFLTIYTSLDYTEFDLADLRLRRNHLTKEELTDNCHLLYPIESFAGFATEWDGHNYVPNKTKYRVVFWFDN